MGKVGILTSIREFFAIHWLFIGFGANLVAIQPAAGFDSTLVKNTMARQHSRKHGKSGSSRPARIKKPDWVTYSAEEVEQLVVQMGKKGETASIIGLRLRDQYGIPLVKAITGKKIQKILQEHNITTPLPEDFTQLAKKALNLRKHLEENKKDLESKKGLQRTESKIYRLLAYYKAQGIIEADFKYKPEKVKLLIR